MNWLKHLLNVPMAMLIGVFLGIAFMCLLGSELGSEFKRYGTFVLTAIVTLTASAAALATAIWSSEAQREKKLMAAKASLPLALSQLTQVAQNGFFAATRDIEFLSDRDNADTIACELAISDETFRTLKECIEHSDKITATWLANVISHYQVYRSRLLGSIRDSNEGKSDNFRARHAAEWIFWSAMVAHLFDFSRGSSAAPERLDPEKRLGGFNFEIAGMPIQTKILEHLKYIEEHYGPLSAVSVQFSVD